MVHPSPILQNRQWVFFGLANSVTANSLQHMVQVPQSPAIWSNSINAHRHLALHSYSAISDQFQSGVLTLFLGFVITVMLGVVILTAQGQTDAEKDQYPDLGHRNTP
jgi:hypothetical protein